MTSINPFCRVGVPVHLVEKMVGFVANFGEAYVPPADFVEDAKEALVDIKLTDSSELWLMQWPSKLVC